MPPTLLIVDDDAASRELILGLYRNQQPQLRTLTAVNGADALRLARQELPGVMVLDVRLPDLDGFEVCRLLKADAATAGIRIVMISGALTDAEHRIQGLQCGADGYLCKPFLPAELLAQVHTLFRWQAADELEHARLEQLVADRTRALTEEGAKLREEVALRRAAEAAAQQREGQLRAFGEALPDVALILDEDGRYVEILTSATHLLYQAASALKGRLLSEVFAPEQAALFLGLIQKTLASGLVHSLEYTLDLPQGVTAFEARVAPIHGPAGAKREVVLLARDVTARVQTESLLQQHREQLEVLVRKRTAELEAKNAQLEAEIAERQRAEDGLRQARSEAEHRSAELKAVLDSMTDIVLGFDSTGQLVLANAALRRLLGLDPAGTTFADQATLFRKFEASHPDGQPVQPEDRHVLRVLQGETITDKIYRITTADGRKTAFSCSTAPITAGGKIVGTVTVGHDLTERVQAEEELLKHESFLDTLLNAIPIPVFYKDKNGRYRGFNRAYETFLGATRERLIDKTVFDLSPPELADFHHAKDAELYESGGVQQYESLVKNMAGELRAVVFHKAVFTDRQGAISGLIGAILDITERKQAEEELRKLSRALEHSPATTVITDAQGRIEYVNPAFVEVTGYSAAEALEQNSRMLKSGRHPPEFYQALWATIRAGQVWHGEFCNRKKNGELYYEAAAIAPIRDAQGAITHFVAVKEDLSGQKQVEEALRESQAQLRLANEELEERVRARTAELARINQQLEQTHSELRDGEERYRVLADTTPDLIYSLDSAGRHTAVNRAFCDTLGLPESQIIGRTHAELDFPADYVRQRNELHRRSWNGEVVHSEIQTTFPRGTQRSYDVVLRPILDPQGTVTGIRGRSRDITDQRQAEAQLVQSQKLEAVGILAGGVAHDFNNLLTIILGYSESLLRELHAGDPMQLDVHEIMNAGQRAASLTRQLLAFSRKQALQPEVLDLNAVVRNLEKMLRRLIGEDVNFQTTLADDLGRVLADPGQLEQVIMNLVVNARDAMPRGGTLTVTTRNVNPGERAAQPAGELTTGPHILMAISDTGCGMDENTKAKLFEPFFTTKEKGKGTGLGLSTVYGIVKQSGGSIELDSAPGRGTTFRIYLPRVAAEATSPVKKPVSSTPGKGELILLVEDDGALRSLFQAQIKRLGYRSRVAANGGEAVLACEEEDLRPDLLLTDVVMPGMSGAVLALRLLRTQPDLKVLFMSGYTYDAIEQHGVLALNKPLLQKPFNLETLARKIQEVLEARPADGAPY